MDPAAPQVPVTDSDGAFIATGLGQSNCTLTPHMHGKVNGAATPLDAVYALQAVVGTRHLDAMQQLACDTSGNGTITPLDAVFRGAQRQRWRRRPAVRWCDWAPPIVGGPDGFASRYWWRRQISSKRSKRASISTRRSCAYWQCVVQARRARRWCSTTPPFLVRCGSRWPVPSRLRALAHQSWSSTSSGCGPGGGWPCRACTPHG